MKDEKIIALFDFDGTITDSDSLKHFLIFYFSAFELLIGAIKFAPIYLKYLFGKADNSTAKEALFRFLFKSESIETFNKKCEKFASEKLPQIIKKEALERIKWHKNQDHEILVVSASIENYLIPFFKTMEIPVIATGLEVSNGKLAGNFNGKNCYGIEKCNRINHILDLKEYKDIYVYGDSKGDKEMLDIGTETFYRKLS